MSDSHDTQQQISPANNTVKIPVCHNENKKQILTCETFIDKTILKYLGTYTTTLQRGQIKKCILNYFESNSFPRSYQEIPSYNNVYDLELIKIYSSYHLSRGELNQLYRNITHLLDALVLLEVRSRLKNSRQL